MLKLNLCWTCEFEAVLPASGAGLCEGVLSTGIGTSMSELELAEGGYCIDAWSSAARPGLLGRHSDAKNMPASNWRLGGSCMFAFKLCRGGKLASWSLLSMPWLHKFGCMLSVMCEVAQLERGASQVGLHTGFVAGVKLAG